MNKNSKILVIEDEAKISDLIKKVLEAENHIVDTADNGQDGLIMAKKGNYDLILLDIMLPKLNGLEVCKALRYSKISTPIIMLTAKDTIEDRLSATDAGANDYLSKPFVFDALLSRINANLSSGVCNEISNGTEIVSENIDIIDIEDQNNQKENESDINKRIMDSIPVSIITIDKSGNMKTANKYYEEFSRTKEYKNHNIFASKFFIRENLVSDFKKLLDDGTIIRRDHCFERNNKGEDKYLKIIAVPLVNKDGEVDGAVSMALDNTESVLLQKKLQLLNEDLEKKVSQRTAELHAANENLAKVMDLKATFIADVSHEMRTSLAIIQGSIELMSLGLVKLNETKETYTQIFGEISRMSNMLSDMTLLSESETSKQDLDRIKIDLNKFISDACKSLKVVASKKGIRINHKKSKLKVEIVADAVQIEKLIMNLVSNAIRYNKENGLIDIWTEKGEKEVILKVRDTGIGIAKEYIANIFERFYRVDKARSRSEGGSGLGLAICKWVAEIHGGSISVESVLGEGSLFIVKLPINCQSRQ